MGTHVSVDSTHSTVSFTYHNATAQTGTVILGDILATVPNSAANNYKTKELLALSGITVTGADFTGGGQRHPRRCLPGRRHRRRQDRVGRGDGRSVAPAARHGLSAYRLLDPAIIGDIAGDVSIDATAVTDLASFISSLPTPQIPAFRRP